jgi:hypothetical protein
MGTRTTASEAARDRRAEQLEVMEAACRELLSSDGWGAGHTQAPQFHRYSLANTLVIAAQRPDATRVAGGRSAHRRRSRSRPSRANR